MSSDLTEYEKYLDMFEKIFTKMGIWPSTKIQPIRYVILFVFIFFCVLFLYKVIFYPERESIENGIVNTMGCIMAILFAIRMNLREEQFVKVFEFIRNDLSGTPSPIKKEVFIEIVDVIKGMIKFVTYIFPVAIIPKLFSPFLEYGFKMLVQSGNNVSLILPPPMALPQMSFLYFDGFIIYVLECSVRMIMLCWLMGFAFIYAISSLYLGGQFRALGRELEALSIENEEIFDACIKRHNEILSITKKLNNIYRFHMLVEYIVSYVNWAVLLLSMFAGNGGALGFFNDMLLTTAGGSQFVFIHYFGGRIAEMSLEVFHGAYCSDWTSKPIKQQKKLYIMMMRARKSSKLCLYEHFITASLENMMNLFKDSYASFNILKSTMEK
ncbi:unnamed protein product [Chironomus riparius]|uniref:Odorant receptor n=1 Tax=Chironomus riparius TaxID=315576 RepID=A0A9P0IXX1_9DIPT|nr:unnamed protein product [Chironomus riparius]